MDAWRRCSASAAWLDGLGLWGLLSGVPHGTKSKQEKQYSPGASWMLGSPHGTWHARQRAGCLAGHLLAQVLAVGRLLLLEPAQDRDVLMGWLRAWRGQRAPPA